MDDVITESGGSWAQDTSYVTEANNTAYIEGDIILINNGGIDFTSVDYNSTTATEGEVGRGSGWSCSAQTSSINVPQAGATATDEVK